MALTAESLAANVAVVTTLIAMPNSAVIGNVIWRFNSIPVMLHASMCFSMRFSMHFLRASSLVPNAIEPVSRK